MRCGYQGPYLHFFMAAVVLGRQSLGQSIVKEISISIYIYIQKYKMRYGHKMTNLKKVVNDSVGISENGEWTLLKDPLAEIQKAVNAKDYFKIVAYACSIFEFCGKQGTCLAVKEEG